LKPKVFITRELPGEAIKLISEVYDVEVWHEYFPPPREVLLEKVREVDALASLLTDKIDGKLLILASKLRIVAQYAVGYDNIDIEECTRRGVYVTNTPGVLTEAVADLTWALILSIARRIVEADNFVRSGLWENTKTGWHPSMMIGVDVHGKTLGIIGLGRIGSAVARRAKCFDMKILYYDVERRVGLEKTLDAVYVDLDDLLKLSDFISLHVPLTKSTYHLIGERELKLMKPTAFLINTSRGAVVDEKALVKALKNKWIAGAALDVFETEPTPKSNPLLKFRNVIVVPHIGSASRETRERMALMVAENLLSFARGEVPPNLVNKQVLKIRPPGFS